MSSNPTARPTTAGTRGPVSRQPTLSPTGYRVSDRRRFELRMAGLFTGHESLQDIIDLAVSEFLDRLREQSGFQAALTAAELEQQRRAGIRTTPSSG